MADANRLQDMGQQFMALPPARRMSLVATAAVSLGFFLWIATGQSGPRYGLLYRGLPEGEVAKVVDALAAERIDYRLEDGGTSVYVPAGEVYEARIRVAGKGLPAGGGVGFEIFDRSGFGVTHFVQRVNFQRALQGELARSIEQLQPVERARVQVAIPEESTLIGRDSEASASVVVKVRPGGDLDAGQVQGIVHLVASSVDQLDPSDVSVVDSRGHLLSSDAEGTPNATNPTGVQNHRNRLEEDMAHRIESILARPVGAGRVVARVSADLDWTQTETTEESFDPNSQVERSERRSTETSNEGGASREGGVPGALANDPAAGTEIGGGPDSMSNRTTETINYELSKKVSHSVTGGGRVQRLSIAVLIDGKPGGESGEFVPWEESDLQSFERLARQAIGFSEDRGDEITVVSAPFHTFEIPEETGGLSVDTMVIVTEGIRGLGLLAAALIFAFMVVRPLMRSITPTPSSNPELPARLDDLEARLALATGGAASGAMSSQLGELGVGSPAPALSPQNQDETLRTLQSWVKGESA